MTMAVNQPLHSSLKSAERANSKTEKRRESRVRFHGVAIREFARSLGDNPASDDGPPLGLSWEFWDVKRERKGFNDNYPIDMIPIDDYEKAGERRRNKQLADIFKLQEKTKKKLKPYHRVVHRQKTTKNYYFEASESSDESEHTLTEEQMKQLSTHWFQIQPLPGQQRERIILEQTNATKVEILENEDRLFRIRQQRRHSAALAESGIDDWNYFIECIKRRYRRFKSGISKQQEQALLWEKAKDYWTNHKLSKPHSKSGIGSKY